MVRRRLCCGFSMIALGGLLMGCTGAQQRFEREYGCSTAEREFLGNNTYRYTGCGVSAIYVCNDPKDEDLLVGPRCIKESETRVSAQTVSTEVAVDLIEPSPSTSDGKGVSRYDRFKKRRVYSLENMRVESSKGRLRLDYAVVTEDRGQPINRPDGRVVVYASALPGFGGDCQQLDLLADDEPIAISVSKLGARMATRVAVDDFAVIATADKLEGRLCGHEFALSGNQTRNLSRFYRAIVRKLEAAAPSEEANAI